MILARNRVAIIGAGLSGLACAVELKRNGITPVVFEKTNSLGGGLNYLVSVLRIFYDSYINPEKYLKSRYGITLKPVGPLRQIVMKGPTRSTIINGRLGYIFSKGTRKNSMENQLVDTEEIDISFDSFVTVSDIEKDFDNIVVATGNHIITDESGDFKLTFHAQTRTAQILGDFETGRIKMWLNRKYANSGYGYMVANSRKDADLVLIVTGITGREMDHYWLEFLRGEDIKNTVTTITDVENHIGPSRIGRNGKLYYVGNAGGMIDSFLGFGAIRSVESGILAARSIAGKCDFNKVIKPHMAVVEALGEYRRMLDGLDDDSFDRMISFVGLPFVKQAIYNNPFYKAKNAAFIPKFINRLKDDKS